HRGISPDSAIKASAFRPEVSKDLQKRSSLGPQPSDARSEAEMSGHSEARIPVRIFVAAALVAVAAMVPVRTAHASGSVYYVATNGSDSNDGSLSKPWRTVGKGLVSLNAGDTLLIGQGAYIER